MSPLPMIHKTSLYRPPVMALPSSGHQIWDPLASGPCWWHLVTIAGDLIKFVLLLTLPQYWHLLFTETLWLASSPYASHWNAFLLKSVDALYHKFFLKVELHVLWSYFDLTDVGRNCSSLQSHVSLQTYGYIYPNNTLFNWVWWTKITSSSQWNITSFFNQIDNFSSPRKFITLWLWWQ